VATTNLDGALTDPNLKRLHITHEADRPPVSILIPAYNAEAYIEETLLSIIAQTFTRFECVVINDGSSDRTAEIVQTFLADQRFKLVNLPKVGLCAALNQGMALCRASLIARMDADDVMLPERLAVQLAFLESHPDVAGCSSDFFLMNGAGAAIREVICPLTSVHAIETQLRTGGQIIYSHGTVMYRREAVVELGGYRSEYYPSEDVDLFVRMYEAGKPIINLPMTLIKVRVHPRSVSSNSAVRQFHTNKLIFRNLAARRRGEVAIEIQDYFSALGAARGMSKVRQRCEVTSFVLHRNAAREISNKRRIRGHCLLIGAILLNPADAYRKLTRRLLRYSARGSLQQAK
jgi:glycosyltransferase involved in cell wall biosynthesis